jgi:hypothetical protein
VLTTGLLAVCARDVACVNNRDDDPTKRTAVVKSFTVSSRMMPKEHTAFAVTSEAVASESRDFARAVADLIAVNFEQPVILQKVTVAWIRQICYSKIKIKSCGFGVKANSA